MTAILTTKRFSSLVQRGVSSPDPIPELVLVNPSMAEEILRNNPDNRPISDHQVVTMAYDMVHDKWDANGEAIQIDKTGNLINGQNRMSAVVRSGKTSKHLMVFGVDRTARKSIDKGRARTHANDLTMFHGVVRAKKFAGILNGLTEIVWGRRFVSSFDQLMAIYNYFKNEVDWAHATFNTNSTFDTSPISAAMTFAHRTNPAGIEEFVKRFRDAEGLVKGEPAHQVHVFLAEKKQARHWDYRRQISVKLLRAAMAHLEGESFTRLYANEDAVTYFAKAYGPNLHKDLDLWSRIKADDTTTTNGKGKV